jgi:hypothetical protein
MKKFNKISKENIKIGAKTLGNILLAGIAIAGVAGIAVMAPNAVQILKYVLPEDDIKRHYKYRANHSLKKLISDGYVQEKIMNGKKIFTLTTKGKLRYESLRERKNRKWDGKWRIVSFDVYEKNRKKRYLLRRELQTYGFQMMHQSMWIYPHPCDEYVALLKSDLSFGKNVQYMLVDYVDMHMELKKMFNL